MLLLGVTQKWVLFQIVFYMVTLLCSWFSCTQYSPMIPALFWKDVFQEHTEAWTFFRPLWSEEEAEKVSLPSGCRMFLLVPFLILWLTTAGSLSGLCWLGLHIGVILQVRIWFFFFLCFIEVFFIGTLLLLVAIHECVSPLRAWCVR